MESIIQLLTVDSIAHTVLVVSMVAALGLAIGSVRVFGINLGIAGVLFAGLIFGHFKITIGEHVLEFLRDFGLILFAYTIGMQVGPGVIASFKKEGLALNLMAAAIVVLGALTAVAVHFLAGIDAPAVVGMLAGATTNTPSLAAAQQTLQEMPGIGTEAIKTPGLGYAVAYPFGIIGIIVTMVAIRVLFRVSPAKEAEAFEALQQKDQSKISAINLEVRNGNLEGVAVRDLPLAREGEVVISRIFHSETLSAARPDLKLHVGDTILAVGTKEKLEEFRMVVGVLSALDLRLLPSQVHSRRVIVTRKSTAGKTLADLNLRARYGVTVTRVSRAGIEMAATPGFRLQFADTALLVGEEEDLREAARELGDSPRQLNHPQLIPVFLGIALGVVFGTWPIYLPGIPAAVKLGLAGGPLLVAIFLSRLGSFGRLVWYMPISANFMLREIGIVLFLSCVGLKSGDKFLSVLLDGEGFIWMGWAAVITLLPILIVALYARWRTRMNYMVLCGLLAGSMTDPPALAYANALGTSPAPSVSYATVYPLVMVLRIVCAQVLVLVLMR